MKVQPPSLVVSPERIGAMDEQGIDIEALSVNPIFWYKAEPDLAGQVVKLRNEKVTEICAAQPDRFVGLASVALQHPEVRFAPDSPVEGTGFEPSVPLGILNPSVAFLSPVGCVSRKLGCRRR